jgi:hypothetical protein
MEAKLAYNREEFSHPSHPTLRTHKSARSDLKNNSSAPFLRHFIYGTVLFLLPAFYVRGFGLRVYFVCSYGLLPRNAFAASESETPQCFTSNTHKTEDAETFRYFAKRNRAMSVRNLFFRTRD